MRIREATPHDLEDLCAIERVTWPRPWGRARFETELTSTAARLTVACDGSDGSVLGFCLVAVAADELEVHKIAVHPAAQRRGVGAALLREALAFHPGVALAFLEVGADNAPARALYHGLGFEQVGRRPRYYADGTDALVLRAVVRKRESP